MNNFPLEKYVYPYEKVLINDESMIFNYDNVIITDKNIICITEKMWRKPEQVEKYPFDSLITINNRPGIDIINENESSGFLSSVMNAATPQYCILLNFKTGQLRLELDGDSAATQLKYVTVIANALSEATTGSPNNIQIPQSGKKTGLIAGIRNTFLNTNQTEQKGQSSGAPVPVSGKCIACRAPISGMKNEKVTCIYCDTVQVI